MGCVTVKLNEEGQNHKQILMFSWCSKCQEGTPRVGMQKDTWRLSFAKYLEMRFHGHAYRRRQCLEMNETDSEKVSSACKHSLHRDYVQYFSCNGYVASFSYTPIEIWEIGLPSIMLELKVNKSIESVKCVDELKMLSSRGYEIFATIYDRLAQLLSDVEFPMLKSLKQSLNNDQLLFREKVSAVQTLLTETFVNIYEFNDAMLLMKKTLVESIDTWMLRLSEASTQYRAICAAAVKQESSSTANSASVSSPATVAAQQSPQPSQQLPVQVDAGTICTEDFKSEPESPNVDEASGLNVSYNRELSAESEKSVASEAMNSPNVVEKETKSTPSDKKSVKTILRDLLPSDKNVQQLIQSPIPQNEHLTLTVGCVPVVVHDQDFSSVIAYSLASYDYKKKLESLSFCDVHRKSFDSSTDVDDKDSTTKFQQPQNSSSHKENDKEKKSKSTQAHIEMNFQNVSSNMATQFTCIMYFARDFDSMRCKLLDVALEKQEYDRRKHTNSESDNRSIPELDRRLSNNSLNTSIESPKCDEKSDDSQKKQIDRVRKAFIRSLSKSIRWEARGGKSGSKFCKTLGKIENSPIFPQRILFK